MYNNSGAKVKGLATVIVTLSMIGSVILGLILMVATESFLLGAIVIGNGCFVAWLSGLMLAAFGEMVENTYYLRKVVTEKLGEPEDGEQKSEYTEKKNENVNQSDDEEVTDEEIREIRHRLGVGIGDAMAIAREEKRAKKNTAEKHQRCCPNCNSPYQGAVLFCGKCGTRLQ